MKVVKDGKILLTHFKGSEMEKDASFEIQDFYRVKNYIKPQQMMHHHRYRDFSEPYMVARSRLMDIGGLMDLTWNHVNRVFTVQLPYCNLNCKGCYVDRELIDGKNAKYVHPQEIISTFMKVMGHTGVLRISGGEVFLNSDAIILIIKEIIKTPRCNPYIWIETNLLGTEYMDFMIEMDELNFYNIGISGCFKGISFEDFHWLTGENEGKYQEQWDNAHQLFVDCRALQFDIFFSVPEVMLPSNPWEVNEKIVNFIENLSTMHHNLPLRTTVLTWKDYNANKGTLPDERFESGMTRQMYVEALINKYGPEMVWLPQHQVNIE